MAKNTITIPIDLVAVVRCRDCKHFDEHDKRCKVWNHGVLSIGYCYRGEERKDEKDLDACVSGGCDISNDKCRGE